MTETCFIFIMSLLAGPLTVQNGHCIIILCLQDCSTNHFIILMKYNKHKQTEDITGVLILLILKFFSTACDSPCVSDQGVETDINSSGQRTSHGH